MPKSLVKIAGQKLSLMEVTGALTSAAGRTNFAFGADTALVAVQHLLWQTVDLFRAAAQLGLRPHNIFALGKVYSNSVSVIRTLRGMGVTVLEGAVPKPGEFEQYFERDVSRLWDLVSRRVAERRIRRIIVLDDGGGCIRKIPSNLLDRYVVGGVEQTSRGMFVFEENPPPFAVVSWARTAVKLHIGGPIFSHLVIDKLKSQLLNGTSLTGAEVGVLGVGSIGRGLANFARRQHNNVMFYDPDPDLQIPRYLREGITQVDSLEKLMSRCDYVFGCSGRNPFADIWPLAYKPGVKLFSASGGDDEFRPIINDLKNRPSFKVDADTWDITCDGPSGPVRIGYLGYPYNFVSRGPEAVPTCIVQLETGGLLAAMIQARSHLDLCEKGKESNVGIHRLCPGTQRVVYEIWLKAMRNRRINLKELYDYNPATVEGATNVRWFADNSEPQPGSGYHPCNSVEDAMKTML